MARRQRQADELRELCRSGSLARAVDLAFQHVAEFGPDDELLALLADAVDRRPSVPDAVRRRLTDLLASTGCGSAAVQRCVSGGAHRPSQTRSKENPR
jgi:hypothetical protein